MKVRDVMTTRVVSWTPDERIQAMHSMMGGPSNFHGLLHGPDEKTPDRVRAFLDHQLEQLGSPRLKIGQIARAANGNITAEIVTIDGSLVQKLGFNRYPGLVR